MTGDYLAIAVGAVLGAVGGLLIRFAYSRVGGQVQARPLSKGGRVALRVFLVVYVVIVSGLLTALVITGNLVSTLPYIVVAIVAGSALVRVWSARTSR